MITPETIVIPGRLISFAKPAAALAIADSRIVATGAASQIRRLRRRSTRVVELPGAVVTPGLVDCHTHYFYWALQSALVIDLSQACSLAAVLQTVQRQARRKRLGDWVVGAGFDQNRWGTEFPHARDLDAFVPDAPALLRSRDGHSAWLNTAALRRLNISAATPDPTGGRFLRDHTGAPTGIVQEAALEQLPDPVRELACRTDRRAEAQVDAALEAAERAALRLGLTGVHSMDDGPSLAHLQRRHGAGRLALRVLHAVQLAELDRAVRLGLRSGFGDDRLRLGGVKIFADGSLGSQSAWMFEPYPGRGDFRGVPVTVGAPLREALQRVVAHGWAAWIHAIGDRAVHDVVQALRAAGRPKTSLPHRIEHVQCIRPADIRALAQAGIVASVQPCHILGDILTADRHWPRARRNAYPFRSLLDAGATLAAGSDVPVESLDPRRSLFAAVSRTDEASAPSGGWFPRQRITVEEALRAFTVGAARAAGQPAPVGTLAPGAPADLTLWAEDPRRVPPERLLDIGILGCMVGGELHCASC